MASNRFKERVKYRRKIMTAFSIIGFILVMSMGIAYSYLLPVRLSGTDQITAIVIGDVIKVIFAFSLAWVLRSLYLNNVDVLVSKMEHYEMKVFKGIIDHEIEREEKARADEDMDEEEIKKFKKIGGKR